MSDRDPDGPTARFERAMALLGQACERRSEERRVFLAEKITDDPELLRTVESMLDDVEAAWSKLEPHPDRGAIHDEPTVPEEADRFPVVGDNYCILRRLSEGGMGEVFLARQDHPVRHPRVALKVAKLWGADAARVLARFEVERQALGLMEHDGISRIFDAGSTKDGRPYFVMEYVDGSPITRFCDASRLPIAGRLRLFQQVCAAVQHAHQKGVIHRDLKPSNILVAEGDSEGGGEPAPKVIDFGIAKAFDRTLTEGTLTGHTFVLGTPGYQSPEQFEPGGARVDTRTDIYSLGVVLCELLVGLRPFEDAELPRDDYPRMRRVLLEKMPPRPSQRLASLGRSAPHAAAARAETCGCDLSTLERQVRGDLDKIVMKCLEKDPEQRYESPAELARDIGRFLRDEPVQAVAPSIGYRLSKFVVRRRVPLAVATALSLLAAIAVTQTVDRLRTRRVLDRAESARLVDRARYVAFDDPQQASEMLKSARLLDESSPGPLLEMARLEFIRGQTEEAQVLARSLLEGFPESGEGHALVAGLLKTADPSRSAEHAAEARRLLVSDDEGTRGEAHLELALSYGEIDPDAAIASVTRSLKLYPWEFEALWRRALLLFRRAQRRTEKGDVSAALLDLDGALSDAAVMVRVREELDLAWIQQGAALLERSRISRRLATDAGDEAAEHAVRAVLDADGAIDALNRAVERDASRWMSYFDRALALAHRARFAIDAGDRERADRDREAGVADLDRAIALEDRRELHMQKRRLLHDLERYEDALAAVDRAIELGDHAEARFFRATELRLLLRFEEAYEDVGRAIDGARRDGVPDTLTLAEIYEQRADLGWLLGHPEQSERDAAEAVALDPTTRTTAHVVLGKAAAARGDAAAVEKHFDDALRTAGNRALLTQLERGAERWKLGRDDLARGDFVAYAESGDPWIHLWIWELERLRGDRAAAERALGQAARSKDALLTRVVRAVRGEIPPEAIAGDEGGEAQLYALYYLGVIAFVEGRHAEAVRWFRECRALGYAHYLEHDLAGWHLTRLATVG